ncbi:MAG: sulfatase-like hydrolase/transferase [Pseudobdellovibrio sp.]
MSCSHTPLNRDVPYHVLVLKFCSVNTDDMAFFSKHPGRIVSLPNFEKTFKQSYLFLNAYSDLTWSNQIRYLYGRDEKYTADYRNYFDSNPTGKLPYILLNVEKTLAIGDHYIFDREADTQSGITSILQQIDFYHDNYEMNQLLIRYAHYPYISKNNLTPERLAQFLNPEEVARLSEYFKNPKKYTVKLPLLEVLVQDKRYFTKSENEYVDLLENKAAMKAWENSPGYDQDIAILKKAYAFRLKALDQYYGRLLDYYMKYLEKDTILVVTGDHGEGSGEHHNLAHSGEPYDEKLHFFFAVHFPGQQNQVTISELITQRQQADLFDDMIYRKINSNNFVNFVQSFKPDTILVSYNCLGDIASARLGNKWKLFVNFNSEKEMLYDLEKDPEEKHSLPITDFNLRARLRSAIENDMAYRNIGSDHCIN